MKKNIGIIMLVLTVSALLCAIGSTAFAASMKEQLTHTKERALLDRISLRADLRTLEDRMNEMLAGWFPSETSPKPSVGTAADVATDSESITEIDAASDTETDGTEESETIAGAESENSADSLPTPTAAYVITVHEGVIGVFDTDGALVRVVNVYVETLPQADRAALAEGIEAADEQEMREIVDRLA